MKGVRGQNFSVRFTRRGMAVAPSVTETSAQDTARAEPVIKAPEPVQEPVKTQATDDIFATVAAMAKDAARQRKEADSAHDRSLEKLLRLAAYAGDCGAIRRLVMEGADLDARDKAGRTALNIATQYNKTDAIKTILAAREMRRMAALGELPETSFFKKFKTPAKNGSVK